MIFVFCGFMGSGKSFLLNKLRDAAASHTEIYVDLDQEILTQFSSNKYNNLRDLIEGQGWEVFRSFEKELLKKLIRENDAEKMVLAVGGGALSNDIISYLNERENTLVVFLNTSFEVCWKRISKDGTRPLVDLGHRELKNLYQKRMADYNKANYILSEEQQKLICNIDDLLEACKG